MKRVNNKERAGLHFIAHLFESEYNWIFREQPISDVGIDAIIEKSVEGDPTGKLLALQIKSGKGNVKENDDSWTYYISNTHYYYWTNFEIPVVIALYVKSKKKNVYWQYLKKTKIKRTKTRWKIEIPKSQRLNKASFKELNKIIIYEKAIYRHKDKTNNINTQIEIGAYSAIFQVKYSVNVITDHVVELGNNLNKLHEQLQNSIKQKDPSELKFTIYISKYELQYVLSSYAERVNTEIQIFTKLFCDALYGLKLKHRILEGVDNIQVIKNKQDELENLVKLKEGLNKAIQGVNSMLDSMKGFDNKKILEERTNLRYANSVSEQLIEEIKYCQTITDQIKTEIEESAYE